MIYAAQVVGMGWQAMGAGIGRRGVERPAQRSDAARHHRVGQVDAGADRDVDAVAGHVGEPVRHLEFDLQQRVPLRQPGEAGQQLELRQHRTHRHPDPAAGLAGVAGELAFQFIESAGDAAAVLQEGLALG
jgi:hypothetical protein